LKTTQAILILSFIWWITALLIPFWGNFPLNDDWAYGYNAYYLAEQGTFRFNDWPAMTLLAQTFWGALFCKFFGFSFTTLRFSTLVIAWCGGIALLKTASRMGAGAMASLIIALIWLFNPLIFSLSYTYMTEVPFLSVILIGTYCLTGFIHSGKLKYYFLTCLFLALSVLIRQTGFFFALFICLCTLFTERLSWKRAGLSFFPLLIAYISLILYIQWRTKLGGLPPQWGSINIPIREVLQGNFIEPIKTRGGIVLFYLGYFFLPITFWLGSIQLKSISGVRIIGSVGIAGLIAFYWYYHPQWWDYIPLSNVFYNLGLGPKVLIDTQEGMNLDPILRFSALRIFKIAGVLASLLFLVVFIATWINWKKNAAGRWALPLMISGWITAGVYFIYLMVDQQIFDRYFLTAYLFILITAIPYMKGLDLSKQVLSYSLILLTWMCLTWFAVSATHDYLSWNKSRWQALNYLTDTLDVSPHKIDGGFEFNGMHQTYKIRINLPHSTSWWFVDEDEFAIAFGATGNYNLFRNYSYPSWLTGKKDSVYILRRPPVKSTDTLRCNMETKDPAGKYMLADDGITLLSGGLQQSNRVSRSGAYSLQLTPESPTAIQLNLPVIKPYDEFRLSCWVFGDPVHWNGLKGDTYWVTTSPDSTSFVSENNYNTRDSAAWYFKQHRVIIPPDYKDSTIQVYIKLKSQSSSVWIDDVEVVRVRY